MLEGTARRGERRYLERLHEGANHAGAQVALLPGRDVVGAHRVFADEDRKVRSSDVENGGD